MFALSFSVPANKRHRANVGANLFSMALTDIMQTNIQLHMLWKYEMNIDSTSLDPVTLLVFEVV